MVERKPVTAYRRDVERELAGGTPTNPLADAIDDWVIGSKSFLQQLDLLAKPTTRPAKVTKRQNKLSPKQIVAFVADQCGLPPADYFGFRANAQDSEKQQPCCAEN